MKLKTKLKYLFSFLLIYGFIFLWEAPVLADTQIYPIPPATTPYGDGTANITNAGWTNTHLLGQSFIVPAGINEITNVRLTRFKLGDEYGNAGGIVSVALFQGEPAVTRQCWNRGLGGDECTNVISASGARVAKKEKIYVPGNQVQNLLNDLCGLPDNNIVTYLINRLQITNPDRPCPTKAEWLRLFNYFQNQGWGDLTNEWVNGRTYPCGPEGENTCTVDGWLNPNTLSGDPGDSLILYASGQAKEYYGSGPAYFQGPGWTTQAASWMGTESDDNYLDVTFDNNVVTPGNQYFLSIQQSHANPNNDPDRNTFNSSTNDYYDNGQFNCENPNEAINASEPGYITIPGYTPGGQFCGQGNVFVAQVSQNNPYPSGRAYINSDKWAGDPTTDVTYLTIQGITTPIATNPTATIAGPASGDAGQSLTYDARIFNAQSGTVFVTRQDNNTFTCPPGTYPPGIFTDSGGRNWCIIRTFTNGSSGSRFSAGFTFQETGTYWVLVNAYANPTASFTASNTTECTGNPFPYNISQWSDCWVGNGDAVLVTINTPLPAPANLSSACSGNQANLSWDAVSGADSYRIRVNNVNDGNWSNWLALNDFVAVVKGSYACFSGWCSFPTGLSDSLPNLDITFCPKTSGICSAAEFTDGPSNIVPGQPYSWSVQSIAPGGAPGVRTSEYSFTCAAPAPSPTPTPTPAPTPTPIPPALSTLYIKENSNDSPIGVAAGSYGRSGLRSTQSGSNYYNSLQVRQSMINATNSNVALVGTAFTGTGAAAPSGATLYELTYSAYQNNGFVLVYAQNDALNRVFYNPGIPGGGGLRSFSAGNFYVYYGGSWTFKPVAADPTDRSNPVDLPQLYVTAISNSMPAGPIFYPRLYQSLGSRNWGTWGYLLDINGNESGNYSTILNGKLINGD